MQSTKAKWDIKSPDNYPEKHGDQSCAKFLDRMATDVKFDFNTSAFNDKVGTREDFFKHVCDSEDKVLEVIKRVGEIIKALLNRAKLIPGLIHSNNMLWRRGELLRKMLEHYGSMSTKLEEEMRVLLQQLAYMAYQVHTLMNALNIQYNPTTGQLTDNKGKIIDSARADVLGIDNRMKDLLEVLASVASGSLYGQKLMLESAPRFSMTFTQADFDSFDDAKKDQIADQIAGLLIKGMTDLGGVPLSKDDLKRFVTFKSGSLVLTVQLTEDYLKTSGITEDQRRILQMAMFNIAFMTPESIDEFPDLKALYAGEGTALPGFEIPSLKPISDSDPVEWKNALQRDFGIDTGKFVTVNAVQAPPAPPAAPAPVEISPEVAAAADAKRANAPGNLGEKPIDVGPAPSIEAAAALVAKALEQANATITDGTKRVTRAAAKAALAAAAAAPPTNAAGQMAVVFHRGAARRGSARRGSARRGSARRVSARRVSARRGSAAKRARKYAGHIILDPKALAAGLRDQGIDVSTLKPITPEAIQEALKSISQESVDAADEESKPFIKELLANKSLLHDSIKITTEIVYAPYFLQEQALNEVVAGLGDVKLTAEVTAKDKMLKLIKELAMSNEVKEFIRVRPYNDKDIRATELQLGTIDQTFDRSPDPQVVQGQLGTYVEYIKSCLGFKKLFEKDKDDRFFDKFSKFIPANKKPSPNEWYATVNGGVFFEPFSYSDKSRNQSEGYKGVSVVPTEMLRLRKQVKAPIDYQWYKNDESKPPKLVPTKNDDPDKLRILPSTPKHDTMQILERQLTKTREGDPDFVQKFYDLKETWVKDIKTRKEELNQLLKARQAQNSKDPSIQSIQNALADLPETADEKSFLEEYYNNRVLSEAINAEFVDTVWPVMQIFFGIPLDDGTVSNDTKNIVTFFYGASGSGKTFSAEAILKKCFDEIRKHKDEFQLKIVSDYNNELYDYYSGAANIKRKQNDEVYKTERFGKNIGESLMRVQQFDEMASRAEYLGWKKGQPGIPDPPAVFWEGNPSDNIKVSTEREGLLEKVVGTYNPNIWDSSIAVTKEQKGDPGSMQGALRNLLVTPKSLLLTIPKDEKSFDKFKEDYDKRVVAFRSVTDTGLNPESSRSHLLYIIIRKTKGVDAAGKPIPMASTERGAQFILADFAGTEDLNYLLTPEAWKIWKEWAATKKFSDGEINGNCKLAGNDVKGDWACLDLPRLANSSDNADVFMKKKFRDALVAGWKAIKIKTLVAKEISEMSSLPSLPAEMEALRKKLTDKWTENLSKPWVYFNGTDYTFLPDDEAKIVAYFNSKDVTSLSKAKQKGLETNPNRFRVKDEDNDNIICNMVLAMHAESKHINDSLKEIAVLIKAQRDAIDAKSKDPNSPGVADIVAMKKAGTISKKMVTEILAGAVTAGSAAVTIGAMNPRRANDWETYKTMVNITEMKAKCD